MSLIYFYGLEVAKDQMNGYMNSEDICKNFKHETWLKYYQRGQVPSKKKSKELVEAFQSGQAIRPLLISFVGKVDKHGKECLLEGEFHIVDGQQRTLALIKSNIPNTRIPVEVFFGLTLDQEADMFRLQRKATSLKPGDHMKSMPGKTGDMIRKWLAEGKLGPIPVTVNGSKDSISVTVVIAYFHWCMIKVIYNERRVSYITGATALDFVEKSHPERSLQLGAFALKNIFERYVEIFGAYDKRAKPYNNGFLRSLVHVIVDHFLKADGKIDLGRFEKKFYTFDTLLNNSLARELMSGGGGNLIPLYNLIVDHLNYKMAKRHLLPSLSQLAGYRDREKSEDWLLE